MAKSKLKDTDYLVISTALRAREAKMLSGSRIDRMLDAQTFDEAAKLLTECGYPDMSGMSAAQVQQVLNNHRSAVYSELFSKDCSRPITEIFAKKYDYHNAKVLVKAESLGTDASGLLSDAGTVSSERFIQLWQRDELSSLPSGVFHAITAARDVLAKSSDPQASDIVIDKAYFDDISNEAASSASSYITGYVKLLIDSANLRTAVRAIRAGMSASSLKNALIPGGNTDISGICTVMSGDKLAELFASSPFENAARLAASAAVSGTMTAFELECDNTVTSYLSKARLVSFGPEAVLAYLVELDNEITTIRMILTGKLSGIAPETIRERLRLNYV